MNNWDRSEFADRMGLGGGALDGAPSPAILGKADVDPATRGMMAATVSTLLDGQGGTGDIAVKYWYRRQNGQSKLVNLFDVETSIDEETSEEIVEEIHYRDKKLLDGLAPERRVAAQEILLEAIREINLHLREGGSPKMLGKILADCNVGDIIGEAISLPGQDNAGGFSFKVADTFNPIARGELKVEGEPALLETFVNGEVNSLDDHRRIDGGARTTYRTNRTNGVTFRSVYERKESRAEIEIETSLEPAMVPEGEEVRPLPNLLKTIWGKINRRAANDNAVTLKAMKFLGVDVGKLDTDNQIRVLGAAYWLSDQIRQRRYPTALDAMQRFDLMRAYRPVDPPGPGGRFSVCSYLGNGKSQTVDGFGFDLGACKVATYEWLDEQGEPQNEKVMLDLGKLLSRLDSDWDGALPDVINILQDPALKGIFISHRHLDHMGAIIELSRLGLLKGKDIYGSAGDLYILQNQMRAEVNDKRLLPNLCPIAGEGIIHFKRLSVEYSVDAMEHSTSSNAYRTVARRTEKTENLAADDIAGSYLFYGDARGMRKPEFLARGLRSFGVERQDTLIDVDTTKAKTPGRVSPEEEMEKNLLDLENCFSDDGILTAMISTNDSGIKANLRVANLSKRNVTFVGHNIEMTARMHNIHGVDPEFERKYERDNRNKFLRDHAAAVTARRTAPLVEKLKTATDKKEIAKLNKLISKLTVVPVESRGRGSGKAHEWMQGNLGHLKAMVTGTQGELFSTLYRFAENWSVLDSDRPSGLKIKKPSKFVAIIDQAAIPGNHERQLHMIKKLIANRRVKCVCVAIEDGFKVYGLDAQQAASFERKYIKGGRRCTRDDDGSLVVSGAPIYRSGHGCELDIADIVKTANADLNHGTHSNDPQNTVAFHKKICEPNGLRHVGRQFNDFEHIGIDMGATPQESRVSSLGRDNSALILFKIIREWGKFFGGTLQAKRVTTLDGRAGYAERGLLADDIHGTFEQDIVAIDFARAAQRADDALQDEYAPDEGVQSPPQERRRYRSLAEPKPVKLTERLYKQIDSFTRRKLDIAA